jgi:hypothetical protein
VSLLLGRSKPRRLGLESVNNCAGFGVFTIGYPLPYHRFALRRLTPTTMRSTRQVLISRWRAALAGVMPRRATIVHTCSA